jgi:polyphosphate kinase 2 (PPK2 family)
MWWNYTNAYSDMIAATDTDYAPCIKRPRNTERAVALV